MSGCTAARSLLKEPTKEVIVRAFVNHMLSFSLNLLLDSQHSELQFNPIPAKELAPSTGSCSFKELPATTTSTATQRESGTERWRERD